MSSADGGGTGFTLQELMMLTAEDRRWFIERLEKQKQKEKEELDNQRSGGGISIPNMPNMPNMPNLP